MERTYKEVIGHYIDLDNNPENIIYRKYLVEKYMSCSVHPRVLDLGCGTGWYSTLFKNYTGVDTCKEMTVYATEHYGAEGRTFICTDVVAALNDFLETKKQFDLVIMQAFIHLFDIDDAKNILQLVKKLCPRKIYLTTTKCDEIKREYAEKMHMGFYRYRTFYNKHALKNLIGTGSYEWKWNIHEEHDEVQKKVFFVAVGENEIISYYEKNGFVVLEKKIPQYVCVNIDIQSENLRNRIPVDGDWLRYGRSPNRTDISRVEKFAHKMPELFSYLDEPIFQLLFGKLLNGNPVLYKEKLNYKLPGDPPFPPHQDMMAGWPKTRYITLGISVDKSTRNNGCLWFVPKKHHCPLSKEKSIIDSDVLKPEEWISMELDSASIIIFDGLAPHRSFPNFSGENRRMIFITYGADLPNNIRTLTTTEKILRQPPIDDWSRLGITAYVRDTFGKFITNPPPYTKDILDDMDLIILLGKKNVGKDTCGNYIAKKTGWKTYAIAKPVKEIAKIAFHLTEEQVNDTVQKEIPLPHLYNRTPRMIMQAIYTELFTESLVNVIPEMAPLFFVSHMEREFNGKPEKIIITDLRSPEYASYLQKKYHTIIIKITRPNEEDRIKDLHSSETNVMIFQSWDYLIENNSTIEDLYKKLDLLF